MENARTEPDRQVDAADHDHRGHANCYDSEDRDLIQNVEQVPEREKGASGERKDDAKHHQANEGALDTNELTDPGGPALCGRRWRRCLGWRLRLSEGLPYRISPALTFGQEVTTGDRESRAVKAVVVKNFLLAS